ncbi:hypothetical protein GFB49_03675 [Epibacterium sp. SM1979]|uniref:Uncharacterized protein n=1 Tax=Tritonibacter litoralis TaxID=2662264 RepID=A0A843YDI9_9RHOB|nr:hypothetical protein [Tritonibacter litoralis]MQQ07544.1 hypothetical protein [Tritonibacter litoralis]
MGKKILPLCFKLNGAKAKGNLSRLSFCIRMSGLDWAAGIATGNARGCLVLTAEHQRPKLAFLPSVLHALRNLIQAKDGAE